MKDRKIHERNPNIGNMRKLPPLHPPNQKKTTRNKQTLHLYGANNIGKEERNNYLYTDLTPKNWEGGKREAFLLH
jgi:hypothetical protein